MQKIEVPKLLQHGDDDQFVGVVDSATLSAMLVQSGTLKVYKGFPRGMATTQADGINPDILSFINS